MTVGAISEERPHVEFMKTSMRSLELIASVPDADGNGTGRGRGSPLNPWVRWWRGGHARPGWPVVAQQNH